MTPAEWLRAVAVWSPRPSPHWPPQEQCIAAIADLLAEDFPPEVFCEATVKLMASRCETFPGYGWCYKILGEVA